MKKVKIDPNELVRLQRIEKAHACDIGEVHKKEVVWKLISRINGLERQLSEQIAAMERNVTCHEMCTNRLNSIKEGYWEKVKILSRLEVILVFISLFLLISFIINLIQYNQ